MGVLLDRVSFETRQQRMTLQCGVRLGFRFQDPVWRDQHKKTKFDPGSGTLQGTCRARFKWFPVETDEHFLT